MSSSSGIHFFERFCNGTHSSTLAWKIPWTEEPGGLRSMGSWRVGHSWATSLSRTGVRNGNPLQCSCLENPRDGGAWWVAVHGVTQSRTWLKRLSSSRIKADLVWPIEYGRSDGLTFKFSWLGCKRHFSLGLRLFSHFERSSLSCYEGTQEALWIGPQERNWDSLL